MVRANRHTCSSCLVSWLSLSDLILFTRAQASILAIRDLIMAGEPVNPLGEDIHRCSRLDCHRYKTEFEIGQLREWHFVTTALRNLSVYMVIQSELS